MTRGEIAAPVPPAIAEHWHEHYRQSAFIALTQRRDAMAVHDLLSAANIRCAALKGAWLAWYAYPAPAERPMRDLDILMSEDEAHTAYSVLRAGGDAGQPHGSGRISRTAGLMMDVLNRERRSDAVRPARMTEYLSGVD